MTASQLIPAAQYLRMSTEHQQYSLENQSAAIQRYADSQGFEVVRAYSDAARSGLVQGTAPAFVNYCKMSSPVIRDIGSSSSTMSAVGDDFKTLTSPHITNSFVNPQAFQCITVPSPLQTTAPSQPHHEGTEENYGG